MPDISTLHLSAGESIQITSTPSLATSHPFLHPDILPLILSFTADATLAQLMRVSRHILTEIIHLRWPVVAYDPSNRRTVIRSRISLPDQPHRFSGAMQVLLAQYARMVVIHPHPSYTCPPRLLENLPAPLARTIQVYKRGLCRSDHLAPSLPAPTGDIHHGARSHCRMLQRYTPSTIRIDHVLQHPLIAFPTGLSFAPTVKRLLLCIGPNVLANTAPSDEPHLHNFIPDHIAEVVFLLTQPNEARNAEPPKKSPKATLTALAVALGAWVGDQSGGAKDRRWIVVGAERLGRPWFPEQREELRQLDGEAEMRERLAMTVGGRAGGLGWGLRRMEQVQFVTLQAYLGSTQTRSELTAGEIAYMTAVERARVAKGSKAAKGVGE